MQLRDQVSELSEEADSIKDKLKSVNALEQELQSLINKSKGSAAETNESKTDSTASNSTLGLSSRNAIPIPNETSFKSVITPQVGGEYIAAYQNESLNLVEETKDDFEEIHSMLDEMVESITQTITQAEHENKVQANQQAKRLRQNKPD